jgi:ArsR family transcriptional regulator, arsenate/arsenite/antimonite-responsive transcriptional repressor
MEFSCCTHDCRAISAPLAQSLDVSLTGLMYFDIVGIMKSPEVVKALSALAQENRLTVFRLLVEQGPDGLTPGVISDKLGIAAPTLSFHLKELANAGLISAEQQGRSIEYSVKFLAMRELVEFLYHNCCGVGVEGCGPECVPRIKVKAATPKSTLTRSRK